VRLTARRDTRYVEPGWRTTALVGVWERFTPWPLADETHTVVESDRRGWAWSIPVTRERRYVVVMVNPELTDIGTRRELEWTYLRELCEFEGVRRLVRGARRSGRVFARDASPYLAERVARGAVLLVGDSASFVDPLSSYGVKKALASAWLGAVVARSVLDNPSVQEAAVELFERREHAMYDALRMRTTALARMARTSEHDFWTARVEADDVTSIDEPDVAALRTDRDVRHALEELKRRQMVSLRLAPRVHRVPKATVRGQRIVLEDHLVAREFPDGVRWIRSVDLVTLADLATSHHQVPELYDAYNRAAPPVPLPDFLGALSVLVGKRLLTFA
jgi:flavin-dependent dehydrogenase